MQADLAQQVQDKARRTQPGDLNGLLEQAVIVSSKPDPALVKMQQRQQQAEYRCAAHHRTSERHNSSIYSMPRQPAASMR
jgi:hypothetical protein